MRKNENELTFRLLHSINGNLGATMHLEAMKEIHAPAYKRAFQNNATGMRDYSAAVREMDEMWRNIFQSGLIKPAARRQPGGGRVADVSVAQYEDEDAFAAKSGATLTSFTFDQVMQQSTCWNCRGFGHVRDACPS